MLSVEDDGIGVTGRKLSALNARLSTPDDQEPPALEEPGRQAQGGGSDAGLGMGLYVVARLAARHGLRVQLRERKNGGMAAIVAVPATLLRPGRAPSPRRPARTGATRPGRRPRCRAPSPRPTPTRCPSAASPAPPAATPPAGRSTARPGGSRSAKRSRRRIRWSPLPRRPSGTPARRGSRRHRSPGPAAPPAGEAAPRPQSVPEQHGRAPGDGFAGRLASRSGAREPGAREPGARSRSDSPGRYGSSAGRGARRRPCLRCGTRRSRGGGPAAEGHRQGTAEARPHGRWPPRRAPCSRANQSANADELRKRLGRFQRGAQHGRRDAAARDGR